MGIRYLPAVERLTLKAGEKRNRSNMGAAPVLNLRNYNVILAVGSEL